MINIIVNIYYVSHVPISCIINCWFHTSINLVPTCIVICAAYVIIICVIREFRDVVFEDAVFDDNSYVTPYKVRSSYRIR